MGVGVGEGGRGPGVKQMSGAPLPRCCRAKAVLLCVWAASQAGHTAEDGGGWRGAWTRRRVQLEQDDEVEGEEGMNGWMEWTGRGTPSQFYLDSARKLI